MKKLIILLLFIPYMFTSCVDVNPNIKADNHISISIDGDNGWYPRRMENNLRGKRRGW